MSGPWEDFRSAEKPPWEDYAAPKAAERVQEDQYRRAAREDLDRSEGTGAGRLQRQVMQGLTFGLADEVIAGAMTPIEMIRRRTMNPVEGYNYAKAREDMALERDRERDGLLGSVAEMGGAVASGVGAARAGLTMMPKAGASLGRMALGGAADGLAYGGLYGAATGSGEERLTSAAKGAAAGAALGGALPVVGRAISTVASPITSNIAARVNPDRYAQRQLARALTESGKTAQQVADDVAAAARDGQGVFTVADAMGDSGQRMLGVVTNNPGRGSTVAREFLDARQAEQGRRLAGQLDDAFGASRTAAQLKAAEEAARRSEAAANYGAARAQATPVDVSGAIRAADEVLLPGATRIMNPGSQIADNSIEAVVRNAKSLLTDGRSNLSDFSQVLLAKQNIDDMIARAAPNQQRVLIGIRNQLDEALAASSQPYAAARDAYKESSRAIEAVDTGRAAATRGRYEDTIPQFRGLNEAQQQGFRVGYADPIIERVQGAAQGVNKAREFSSDAARAELREFTLPSHTARLPRQIGREDVMFQTRARATGNSATAGRLADNEAMSVSPELLTNLLSGNIGGAARALVTRGRAAAGGNTEPVRAALADMLLRRGSDDILPLLLEASRTKEGREILAGLMTRGVLGAGTAAPNALSIPSTNGR